MARDALRLREDIRVEQPAVERDALRAGRIDRRNVCSLQKRERGRGPAVDEFGAELDRHGNARQALREAAAADPVSCFKDKNGLARACQLRGRGEPGGAGADYEDVGLNLR